MQNSLKSTVHFSKITIIPQRYMPCKENLEIGTPTLSQWRSKLWRIFTLRVILSISVFIMSKCFFCKQEQERKGKTKQKNLCCHSSVSTTEFSRPQDAQACCLSSFWGLNHRLSWLSTCHEVAIKQQQAKALEFPQCQLQGWGAMFLLKLKWNCPGICG